MQENAILRRGNSGDCFPPGRIGREHEGRLAHPQGRECASSALAAVECVGKGRRKVIGARSFDQSLPPPDAHVAGGILAGEE